ncbi:MAG: tetratricopeptide repeat protein, partial [Pseudobdellovibrionaceae bacterium]
MFKIIFVFVMIHSLSAFCFFEEYKPEEKTTVFVEAYFKYLPPAAKLAEIKIFAQDLKVNKPYRLKLKKNKDGIYVSLMDLTKDRFLNHMPYFIFSTDEKLEKKLIVLTKSHKKIQRIVMFDDQISAMTYADEPANMVRLEESQLQEWLRMRSQLIEKKRLYTESEFALEREKNRSEFEKLNPKKKIEREKAAVAAVVQGETAYREEKYELAAESFKKSIDLDPNKDRVYYKYGVTLYKKNEFIDSLSAFSLAEGDVENKAEYYYYMGLNNMKLKDLEKSFENFRIARDENDSSVSPMSAFLAGNIAYQNKKYDDAKEDFQYCLDNSQDVAMDKQAELMLEQIDQAEAFIKSTKQIFRYSLYAGYSLDQNILNISQQQGTPTDSAGYRLNYGVTGYLKLRQTTASELGLQASYSDTYSTDTSFEATNTLQAADPLLLNVGLPYRQNFLALDKQMIWSISPSISTVTMNAQAQGREKILDSKTLDTDLMFQTTPKLISAYRMQINVDESFLSSNGTDDDQAATRVTLGTNQSYLLDSNGSQMLAGDLSIIQNSAKGKNNTYDKQVISLLYGFPVPSNINGSVKAEFATAGYKLNPNDRTDSVWTYTL